MIDITPLPVIAGIATAAALFLLTRMLYWRHTAHATQAVIAEMRERITSVQKTSSEREKLLATFRTDHQKLYAEYLALESEHQATMQRKQTLQRCYDALREKGERVRTPIMQGKTDKDSGMQLYVEVPVDAFAQAEFKLKSLHLPIIDVRGATMFVLIPYVGAAVIVPEHADMLPVFFREVVYPKIKEDSRACQIYCA